MADKYTGRHIRQARHGAWLDRDAARARRRSHGLLPAAAALIVSGVLFGGAGVLIQLSPEAAATNLAAYHPAGDYYHPPADPYTADDPNASVVDDTSTSRAFGVVARGACEASYQDQSQRTASGERFDPDGYTAAHKYLPFNTLVRVIANGESVIVRINDRGPSVEGRCLDLSPAAFEGLASLDAGVINVRYEVLG